MSQDRQNIFFLGIGGIGMSAVARYFHHEGHKVSGYDRDKTELTKKLEELGMEIHYEFEPACITDPIDVVVYTPAIKPHQKEFQYFAQRSIRMIKRSEALQEILSTKDVIGIAGTHGKTSTSAILAHILYANDFGATAFIGGIMSNYDTNFLYGESDWVIVEADEYDRSFWRLFPRVAAIQAMDADHLDIYGDEANMLAAYRRYTEQIDKGGSLWVSDRAMSKVDEDWQDALISNDVTILSFGLEHGDVTPYSVSESEGLSTFQLEEDGAVFRLHMAGLHNVQNALAAIAIARDLGLTDEQIAAAVDSFQGISRRFEYVLRRDDVVIIDDYAHHPKEIDAAIAAARAHHPDRKMTVVFQPHLYSRTADFMDEFAEALSAADELVLVELYPAREEPVEGVDSHAVLDKVKLENKHFVLKEDLVRYLSDGDRPLILLLGAGDVYKLIRKIKEAI